MDKEFLKRKKTMEEDYFNRQEAEALRKFAASKANQPLSPVSGKPLEEVTITGIKLRRCPQTEGIWLSKDQQLALAKLAEEGSEANTTIAQFFAILTSTKF